MPRNDVIRRIVERERQALGLTEDMVLLDAPDLHQSACDQFGTWDTALQYAGVTLQRLLSRRLDYSREQVVQKIRLHCRKALKPTVASVQRRDYRLPLAARRHFGTWRQALVAAGVDLHNVDRRTSKYHRLSKEQVAAALHAWIADGHSPRWCVACLQNRALAVAARARFGCWRRAIAAANRAGKTPSSGDKRKWTQQRVIETIQDRFREGRPLRHKAVRKDDCGLLHAGIRQFGGWSYALAAAGVGLEFPTVRSSQ